jgi:hypothetical protein
VAENAQRIGELNVSPDLLHSLVSKPARPPPVPKQEGPRER